MKRLRTDFLGEIFFAFESFEAENQYFGSFVDLHLFFSGYEIFAFGTEPKILLAEYLLLLEHVDALLYFDRRCFGGRSRCNFRAIIAFLAKLIKYFLYFFLIFAPVHLHLYPFISTVFAFRVESNEFSEEFVVVG